MERIKYCDVKNKVVGKEDCKKCEDKDLKPMVFKVCKHAKSKVKCPKCGEEIE